jgi:hypothetical protein
VCLAHANGQIAIGNYYEGWPEHPETVEVLELLTLDAEGRITDIIAFVGTELAPFLPVTR